MGSSSLSGVGSYMYQIAIFSAIGVNVFAIFYLGALFAVNWSSGDPKDAIAEVRTGMRLLFVFVAFMLLVAGLGAFVLKIEPLRGVFFGCLIGLPLVAYIQRLARQLLKAAERA
jgi:hypothetical protein